LGVAVVITAVTGWPAVEVGIFVLGGVIVELQRRINFLQGRAWPDVIGGGVMVGTALAIPAVLALADAPSVYQAVGALGLVQIVWVTATGWRDWTRAFGDGNAMTAWGDLWRVGRWGLASNAAGYAYSYASLFLTLGLIGTTGVAVLELAQQMVTPVQVVMLGMANVWHPVLARAAGVDHPRDFVRVLRRAVWVQTGVGAIVLVTLLVSGPSLVSLLVPGKETLYSGVPSVAWVLGLAVLGQLVWQHPSFAIVALGKPQYGFATRLGTAASVLPLGYLLTAHFGVMGAAWTRAIGEVMVACLSVLILHEVLRSREQCVVMEPNPVGSVR
jgi:O-antigen/teichoic acid export membrane protein